MGTGDAMGTAAGGAMGRSCTFACPIEPHGETMQGVAHDGTQQALHQADQGPRRKVATRRRSRLFMMLCRALRLFNTLLTRLR